MGCWYETCFLTRTPIFPGQEVVMIVLAGRHSLMSSLALAEEGVELIDEGLYDDYGWLEGKEGAYSGGMAERMAGRTEAYERAIFAHKHAWDRAVEHESGRGEPSYYARRMEMSYLFPPPSAVSPLLFDRFVRVLSFCHRARIDPGSGLAFKGSQTEDLKAFEALMEMQREALARWRKDDGGEEE